MIDETLFDAEEKMEKAVSVSRDDLSTIRTGRANPGMFSRIVIDYYGSATPITQLASINVPEARLVVIKPYEASQLGPIETAIRNSDLGVNPTNDGTLIRVAVPPPRAGQASQSQGRRRQGLGAQHPPQGDGGIAPHPQGWRGRRGRGRARREGPGQDYASVRDPDR